MSPRVSVLLTTYNRPEMLAEAIDSVLAQTMQDFELIVLDDASDDPAVLEVLARYWADARVIVYKSSVVPGERAAKARYAVLANIGLRLAAGEYVTYLCDDDLYLPRRLEVMAARLGQGDCQVVYGTQRVMRGGELVMMRPAASVLPKASMIVDHSSVMHTASSAAEAGGWPEGAEYWRHADAAFWDRLTAAGHHFYPVPEVTDVHRFHAGSVSEAGIPA